MNEQRTLRSSGDERQRRYPDRVSIVVAEPVDEAELQEEREFEELEEEIQRLRACHDQLEQEIHNNPRGYPAW